MKRKKLFCALAAFLLLFSQPSAEALLSNERSTVIEGLARLPVINVIVPVSANVIINPFELPVWIGGEESEAQIISSSSYLVNASEVPMNVGITVTGRVKEGSDMTLASSPTGGNGSQKQAFIYFEIQKSSTNEPEGVTWDTSYDPSKHILVIEGTPNGKSDLLRLPAITREREVAAGGCAPFRLTGDAVRNPTNEWTGKDGIYVTVAFTFTPLHYSEN